MPRHMQLMPLDELPEAVRNPKAHDEDGIDASLDRFGYVDPCVLDERTGRLVSGHGRKHRLQAKRAAGEDPPEGVELGDGGVWLVPVYRGWASRSDADAEAYVVAANQLTAKGGWHTDALAELLQDLADQGGGLVGTGYDADDLDDLLASLGAGELDPQPTAAAHAPGTDRGDPAAPREVQGMREVGLMFNAADHREYIELLARLKRAWGQDAAPVVVLTALRAAVEALA